MNSKEIPHNTTLDPGINYENSEIKENDKSNELNEENKEIIKDSELNEECKEEKISEEEALKIIVIAESKKNENNILYSNKKYLEALSGYRQTIKILIPDYCDEIPFNNLKEISIHETSHKLLSILFMNSGLCYKNLSETDKAIEYFSKSVLFNNENSKAIFNRLELNYNKGEYLEAQEDYQKLKSINPGALKEFKVSEYFLNARAEEKKKQMTDQMMGQLKEIGNSFLGMFGLSTDNFKLNQQPGGGYNIEFNQNK